MNIFFLHSNPRKCARYACDKHVVKMILETCQLLYTCHWIMALPKTPDLSTAPCKKGSLIPGYRPISHNHPCSKWLRTSVLHYLWLTEYGLELLREYRHRFGSKKVHSCQVHLEWLRAHVPVNLPLTAWSCPALAMPDEFKVGDAIRSYRRYYLGAKEHILKWTGRHVPHWVKM
jgi:hypothetical protein